MSKYDPLDIPGQKEAKERSAKRQKLSRDNERDDIKWLMSSKRGRRIIWRLLDKSGVFRVSFNTNAMTMAFAEGKRNQGLLLTSIIHESCPELYYTMVSEANEREQPDDGHGRNDH